MTSNIPRDKQLKRLQRNAAQTAPPGHPPQTLPLVPWEIEFCEWLAHQPKRPTISEQREKASELCQKVVGPKRLRNLKDRAAFREFYAELQASAMAKARGKLERRVPEYIDAHKKGLDMALEAHDHRSIPNYTNPILDRVWPRQEREHEGARVVIELTPKQLASINEPPPEVEYEVLTDDDE